MCLRVLLVDSFHLHKLLLFVSKAELRCLHQNSSCITFVWVYPLKNLQLLQVGFARCVGSAKKDEHYMLSTSSLTCWNLKNGRRSKEIVREGQKYVKVYFPEHRHSLHLRTQDKQGPPPVNLLWTPPPRQKDPSPLSPPMIDPSLRPRAHLLPSRPRLREREKFGLASRFSSMFLIFFETIFTSMYACFILLCAFMCTLTGQLLLLPVYF